MSANPTEVTSEPILLREDENGIATLTLNRPKQYNALSSALLAERIPGIPGTGIPGTVDLTIFFRRCGRNSGDS